MPRRYDREQPVYRSKRYKKKKSNFLPIFLLIIAFIVAAVAGAIFASSSIFDKVTKTGKEHLLTANNKVVVMIMGVDEREGDVGRSDTLMIATLDPKKNKAAILSIPRDSRVKIKGHGFDKINAAYAHGGYQLSQDTVENLLGVQIDHHVIINIQAFKKIIDAIGGIDIDVEKRMYYQDIWDDDGGLLIDLQPGMQHMDGKTAITYVRFRDEEGDIGRVRRQQHFMQAVMDKLTSPSIIPRLPSIISEITSSIKTDLSLKQMLELVSSLKNAQKNGLQTEMLPGKGAYIDGISYWLPDLSKLRATIANTLDIDTSNVRNAWDKDAIEYQNSVPSNAKSVDEVSPAKNKATNSSSQQSNKAAGKRAAEKQDSYLKDPYDNRSSDGDSNNRKRAVPSPSTPQNGKTAN